jgi:hypothetical protein
VQGEGQKARPGSIQRIIDEAPNATARATAARIADEGLAKRMPLRTLINQLIEGISLRRNSANSNASTSRAAGMARGGMVKNGNTDLRNKGMFYDSKSPRGYK